MRCLLLITLFLCGCKRPSEAQALAAVPVVLVSAPPYLFFVEKIAEDTVRARSIVSLGADPHHFEPTPKQVAEASHAVAWFQIGEPFEKKLYTVLKEQDPSLAAVNLTHGVPSLSPANGDLCRGRERGELREEEIDRHMWLSPKLAMQQAEKIASTLSALFPEHASFYRENTQDLLDELTALDAEIASMLRPFKGDAIIVSHPAFAYFCQEFGLVQLSVECEGKDPLPQDIAHLLRRIEGCRVRCVLIQAQSNNKGAELIAQRLHVPVYTVDPYSRDYSENLRQIAFHIARS
jgi:zinc transport system substrate-binding protein